MRTRLIALGMSVMIAMASGVLATGRTQSPTKEAASQTDWSKSSSPSVAVRDTALIHTAQVVPDARKIRAEGFEAIESMIRSVISQLDDILKEGGASFDQVVKLNVYAASENIAASVALDLARRFHGKTPPAVSYVTTNLPHRARVAMDAVAKTKSLPTSVQRWKRTLTEDDRKNVLQVGDAAGSTLPAGPRVYISGQAEKGDGSLADATRQTMKGLLKTMEHLGLSRHDVVHLKAFLSPMSESAIAIQEMIAVFPGETPPPIVLVEWESSLPIEIELVAASPMPKDKSKDPPMEFITPPGLKPSPVFCRVVRLNHPATIYLSGIYGSTNDPYSEAEVVDLFASLRRTVEACGSDMQHLAKATYYVTLDQISDALGAVRTRVYNPERPPAASKAKVRGTGRTGRFITLDMIAVPKGP